MSSVQTKYAQRNNNLIAIVPTKLEDSVTIVGPSFDLSSVPVYVLSLPMVQNTGGTYYVDLSGLDAAGNPLNLDGRFTTTIGSENQYTRMIFFTLDVPFSPAYAPGLDVTIFFKNLPLERLEGNILLSLGLFNLDGAPFPEIVSPPMPHLIAPNISNSLTFKSDGTKYNVVSSGPAGWLGAFALSAILAQFYI